MGFNAKKFCEDHSISIATSGQHFRSGWVNIACPFCTGNPGFHGGFDVRGGYFTCYRCGGHWLPRVISKLLKVSFYEAKQKIRKYSTTDIAEQYKERKYSNKVVYPTETGKMKKRHRKYLEDRNFDPSMLEAEWGLLGTGNIGYFKNRIVAPITYAERLISYQTRDVTGKHTSKYISCPEEDETHHYKFALYGMDRTVKDTCILVEGITDVWRLGPGAVCCFGIKFTYPQAIILKSFKRVFILFDAEDQAQLQAERLAATVSVMKTKCEIISLSEGDPGCLMPVDAKYLMKCIGL